MPRIRVPHSNTLFPIVLAVLALVGTSLLLAIYLYTASSKTSSEYRYLSIEEVSKRYLCSECHEKQLVFSKDVLPHPLLPRGVDHVLHLRAAIKMPLTGNAATSYPACYTCHSYFKAEHEREANFSAICSKCHSPTATPFHDKISSSKINCILCHSDWKGNNRTVKLSFRKTVDICNECHTRESIKEYRLSKLHFLHGSIMDCSSCHDTSLGLHSVFETRIIATPNKTCINCHSETGLHGSHYSRRGITCTDCHRGEDIGYSSRVGYMLKACLKCHNLNKTSLHEYLSKKPLYSNCLQCHSEWMNRREQLSLKPPDACNECHPSSFTLGRAYGLHLAHLSSKVLESKCAVCHGGIRGNYTHVDWIIAARNISRCYACHAPSFLSATHRSYFSWTRDCFAAGCHPRVEWSWPRPYYLGDRG